MDDRDNPRPWSLPEDAKHKPWTWAERQWGGYAIPARLAHDLAVMDFLISYRRHVDSELARMSNDAFITTEWRTEHAFLPPLGKPDRDGERHPLTPINAAWETFDRQGIIARGFDPDARLQKAGLVDRARAAHGTGLWFPTPEGRLLLRSKSRLESSSDHNTPWQTDSVLREHTLALNEAGIAFDKAARARGDECDAFSWRHEIAHALTPPRQGREQQWLVADALLSYLEVRDGESVLHQRFIELNLATTSAEPLAEKLVKYTLLHHCRAPATRPGEPGELIWRSHYRTFPQVLVVLAGQEPADARRRIRHSSALWRSDPATRVLDAIPLHFVTLEQLTSDGPYAPIFISAKDPERRENWLGATSEEVA